MSSKAPKDLKRNKGMNLNQNQINKIAKDLQAKIKGIILFDEFSRGRHSTDSS